MSKSLNRDLDNIDLFQENFGDICAFVGGCGPLVHASFTSETGRIICSLGKKCPETEEERQKIVKEVHEGNHVGAKMMFKMIFKDGYYWKSLFW